MKNPRRGRRPARTASVSALLAVVVATGGHARAAQDPPQQTAPGRLAAAAGTSADPARAATLEQAPRLAAASYLRSVVEQHDGSGFLGIALEGRGVEVWWKGKVPGWLREAARSARASAPVAIRKAEHSRQELDTVQQRLVAAIERDPQSPVHGVALPVGEGAVEVTTAGDAAAAEAWTRTRLGRGDQVPLKVVKRSKPRPSTRYSDSSPFSGGAAILNNDGARCTSGFGVIAQRLGYRGLLTAGHCGWPGATFRTGNSARVVGVARDKHVSHDLLMIPAPTSSNVFDGLVDATGGGSGEFQKNVVGWDWTFPGELVCQSGSSSGAVCGLRNTDHFAISYCSERGCYDDLVLAESTAAPVGARPGDSGGPVFTLAGDGQVLAKGIVNGTASSPDRVDLVYQDFATAWRDFGAVPSSQDGVRSVATGRCIDADLATGGTNGGKAMLWDCNGQAQQRLRYNGRGNGEFVAWSSGRCLDADGSRINVNGARVQMWTCNGSGAQRWYWAGDGSIRNAVNNKCLDADTGTLGANGTRLQLWDCNGQARQRWYR